MTRATTVESKRELVEVVVEMSRAHGALMRTVEPSLEQRRDQVDAWQQVGAQLVVAEKRDAMPIAMRLQPFVAEPGVGVDDGPRLDRVVDERLQRLGAAVPPPPPPHPP